MNWLAIALLLIACGLLLLGFRVGHTGRYYKGWGLVLLAMALAAPGITWLTSSRARSFWYSDWEPYKPTFWVIHDLQSQDQKLVQRAVDELALRLKGWSLSAAQTQAYIEELLKLQTGIPPKHLTDIFLTARAQRRLQQSQWEQYWRQAFPCDLRARVISKERLEVWLEFDQRKVRYADPEPLMVGFSGKSLRIGSRECEATYLNTQGDSQAGGNPPIPGHFQPVPLSAALSSVAKGPQAISATVTLFASYWNGPIPSVAKFDFQLQTSLSLPPGTTIAPTRD